MPAGQANVLDADSHVYVNAKLYVCLDNIRPQRAAYLRWTNVRFLVKKRMFSNVFGPEFVEESHARRGTIDSINYWLQPNFLYSFMCEHRSR